MSDDNQKPEEIQISSTQNLNLGDAENELPVFKHSPTSYHENMQVHMANEKKYCTIRDIKKMISRQQFVENDLFILKTLFLYGYMTRYTLSLLISKMHDTDDGVPIRCNYKKALTKLVKNGVILRYYMTWEDGKRSCQSVCFYALSHGAEEYVRKVFALKSYPALMRMGSTPDIRASDILKTATLNQFMVQVQMYYGSHIVSKHLWYDIVLKKRTCSIPVIYRYVFKNREYIDLICMPLRSHPQSNQKLVSFIHACEEYVHVTKEPVFDKPFYLFICENSAHACAIDAAIRHCCTHKIYYLFLLDKNLLNDKPFENLFSVLKTDDGISLEVQMLND